MPKPPLRTLLTSTLHNLALNILLHELYGRFYYERYYRVYFGPGNVAIDDNSKTSGVVDGGQTAAILRDQNSNQNSVMKHDYEHDAFYTYYDIVLWTLLVTLCCSFVVPQNLNLVRW